MVYKIKDITKFLVAYIWSFFLKKKNIWIITERKDECKDNGYHLFKYIRKNHPSINVYYAISKNSNHRKKIESLNNILSFNSIKHYAYAIAATKLIGAFLPCGIPDSICFYKFGKKLVKGKKCFLQHGITKEKIESLMFHNTGIDLFICGAEPEYEYIRRNFGYPDKNVKYTGFARFDALDSETQKCKFILVMPTWRQYLSSQTWGDKNICFKETEYFKRYNQLLSNKKLLKLLEENNIEIVFYPHHEVQNNIEMFSTLSKNICIADEKDYDVQILLKTASLLITDYSSVAFDFAYMGKPVLYYQFDEELYYSQHYKKGYFDYDTMGFGVVCREENELVDRMDDCIKNSFITSIEYQKTIEQFFIVRDNKNCERIFNEIARL